MLAKSDAWGAYAPDLSTWALMQMRRFHIARGRKIRQKIDARISAAFPAVDIKSGGIRYRCRVTDNATEKGIVYRGYRQEYWPWQQIKKVIEKGDTFVDIGANCGVYTLRASKIVGEAGRVVAIEANPSMVDRLRFNVEANKADNVRIVEAAVGEHTGEASLYVYENQLGMTSLNPHNNGGTITVQMKPLIAILSDLKIGSVDALKIDIEGAEDRALVPFLKDAPRSLLPRLIVTETASRGVWQQDLIEALHQAGYSETWKGKSDSAFLLRI